MQNFFVQVTILFRVQFGINLYGFIFQKSLIALAETARECKLIHECILVPN